MSPKSRILDPRALDHCVLPVPNLGVARVRYAALGFTVAPQGTHPFGTVNACVYFADDTFLEPLAVGDASETHRAIDHDNVFVARDALYRREASETGFSALVFKTDDAGLDHASFLADGISAGPMLDFSRDFVDSGGNAGQVSFRLAFAAEPTSATSYFFTCQRINSPSASGRAALENHANGVAGILGVTLSAEDPAHHVPFLQALVRSDTQHDDPEFSADLFNARLTLVPGDGPLRLIALHFAVEDLAATAAVLSAGGVAFERGGHRLTVPPAPGQGAIFIFEEQR